MRRLAVVLALGFAAALLYAATLPENRRSLIDTRGALHPYVHVAAFMIIAWLLAWSTRNTGARLLLCAAVVALGCITETLEWRMYANAFEWTDVILDAMGAVGGTGLGALTMPRSTRRHTRSLDPL